MPIELWRTPRYPFFSYVGVDCAPDISHSCIVEWPAGGYQVTTRFARPAKSRRHAGNGSRQIFVVVTAIGAMLALGALATDQFVTAAKRQAGAAVEASNDDGIYTGSILYMPDTSNICHQWLFNNQNGQFTDNGSVDCEQAEYQGLDGPKQWSAARIRVISTGFRDH
jgi:hypothetical protein